MRFEIDDQTYVPGDVLPVAVSKILEVLRAMPEGKLYTSRRLAREIRYGEASLHKYFNHPALAEYKILARDNGGQRNLFGNAETVRAYKQEIGLE